MSKSESFPRVVQPHCPACGGRIDVNTDAPRFQCRGCQRVYTDNAYIILHSYAANETLESAIKTVSQLGATPAPTPPTEQNSTASETTQSLEWFESAGTWTAMRRDGNHYTVILGNDGRYHLTTPAPYESASYDWLVDAQRHAQAHVGATPGQQPAQAPETQEHPSSTNAEISIDYLRGLCAELKAEDDIERGDGLLEAGDELERLAGEVRDKDRRIAYLERVADELGTCYCPEDQSEECATCAYERLGVSRKPKGEGSGEPPMCYCDTSPNSDGPCDECARGER